MGNSKAILYIDNSISFGGAINSLQWTLKSIDRQKYRPILVTAQNSVHLSKHFREIEWYSLDMKVPWIHSRYYNKFYNLKIVQKNLRIKKAINIIRSLFWDIRFRLPEAFRLYRIGKRHSVKLLHFNNIIGSHLSGIIAAKLLRVPCVAHLRDYERPSKTTKAYAHCIDHHIAISESIKENLINLGVTLDKISVVYDAVDVQFFSKQTGIDDLRSEFGIRENELLIGFFGRIIEWKGVREFIFALNSLNKQFKQFRAIIVGDSSDFADSYYKEVKDLVESLQLKDKIVFTGYQEDVVPFIRMMDVVVHSSITPEPFGMVIIEAMACSKPVVASNVGGGPLEIVIDGETGFLVDPKDSDKIASALIKLLQDSNLRERFGESGRLRVKSNFDSKIQADKIKNIYDQLVSN